MCAAPASGSSRNIQTPQQKSIARRLQRIFYGQRPSRYSLNTLQRKVHPQAKPVRLNFKVAAVGDTVCLRYGKEIQCYVLVAATDSKAGTQALPIDSPLGQSVLGTSEGDAIVVRTAYGRFSFIISRIEK
jgi:transcription elongation GreA/GreB family factor